MNTSDRKKCRFLGYNIGTYVDWDGDWDYMCFMQWTSGPDVKAKIHNAQGDDLSLYIKFETGDVMIESKHDDDDDVILLRCTWRDFIGHPTS